MVVPDGGRKVAIYARVSTGKQEQSLEEQVRILEEYCSRNDFEVVDIFQETASGAKDDRTELLKMMHEVEMLRNHFNTVVVQKFDRFSRSLQSLINNIEFLREHKVDFISIMDGVDTTTPQGKLMFHITGAFAEFERNLIRERTKIGMERARREGLMCHRPRKSVDVDRVMQLYNSGVKMGEIARIYKCSQVTIWNRLNEAGVVKKLDKLEKKEEYRYPIS
jgi:DNA invertase Pin-like site-specific DNA recombinase